MNKLTFIKPPLQYHKPIEEICRAVIPVQKLIAYRIGACICKDGSSDRCRLITGQCHDIFRRFPSGDDNKAGTGMRQPISFSVLETGLSGNEAMN